MKLSICCCIFLFYLITDRDCVALPSIDVRTLTPPKDAVVVVRPPDRNSDARGQVLFNATCRHRRPPPRIWPASPVTYVSQEVGAGAAGTRGAPGAALRREAGAGAQVTHGAPGAALSREVGARAVETYGAVGATLHREAGAGAVGTRGAPRVALSREVGAEAARARGAPEAALSREVGAGVTGTRGAPGAALHQEAGGGAQVTRGGPGAALSREAGTIPPPLFRALPWAVRAWQCPDQAAAASTWLPPYSGCPPPPVHDFDDHLDLGIKGL
jgi:hypothetical protein